MVRGGRPYAQDLPVHRFLNPSLKPSALMTRFDGTNLYLTSHLVPSHCNRGTAFSMLSLMDGISLASLEFTKMSAHFALTSRNGAVPTTKIFFSTSIVRPSNRYLTNGYRNTLISPAKSPRQVPSLSSSTLNNKNGTIFATGMHSAVTRLRVQILVWGTRTLALPWLTFTKPLCKCTTVRSTR